jgi:hypothetical protein
MLFDRLAIVFLVVMAPLALVLASMHLAYRNPNMAVACWVLAVASCAVGINTYINEKELR